MYKCVAEFEEKRAFATDDKGNVSLVEANGNIIDILTRRNEREELIATQADNEKWLKKDNTTLSIEIVTEIVALFADGLGAYWFLQGTGIKFLLVGIICTIVFAALINGDLVDRAKRKEALKIIKEQIKQKNRDIAKLEEESGFQEILSLDECKAIRDELPARIYSPNESTAVYRLR